MSILIEPRSAQGVERARRARSAIIDVLTSQAAISAVAGFVNSETSRACIVGKLDADIATTCREELAELDTWTQEFWTKTPDWKVTEVGKVEFESASPDARFFRSDVLNGGASNAMASRGIVSGVKSAEVKEAFTKTFGQSVEVKSAKFARYRDGDFLRRHSDTVDGRRFGLLAFFSDKWSHEFGGQFMIEYPNGESYAIAPEAGTVALIPLTPGFSHLVTTVNGTQWARYGYSAHYGVSGDA